MVVLEKQHKIHWGRWKCSDLHCSMSISFSDVGLQSYKLFLLGETGETTHASKPEEPKSTHLPVAQC